MRIDRFPLLVATIALALAATAESPMAAPPANFVSGQATDEPRVRVHDESGTPTAVDFLAHPSSQGGVIVGSGNVDGSGDDEILTTFGPRTVALPHVRGWDRDANSIPQLGFTPFGGQSAGAGISCGDLDGDGSDEMLISAGLGIFSPHLRAFDYDGARVSPITSFSLTVAGWGSSGVSGAAARLDADGFAEILTGAGPGAALPATIRGWNYDGVTVTAIAGINFAAFAGTTHGAIPSGGDVDGDGFDEIAATPGPGPTNPPNYSGFDYDGVAVAPAPGYAVTPYVTLYGGRVALGEISGMGRDALVTGPGPDPVAGADVRAYDYDGSALNLVGSFMSFLTGDSASSLATTYGVTVSVGELSY